MGVDPRIPPEVIYAAVSASGEIRRHYRHSDGDFATDLSAVLVAAYEAWLRYPANNPLDQLFFQHPDATA